ncbi:MAG: tyrosine-type recombinase/integrase [Clostridia bacterium]|nr:tyrosine-type recombinase/integrase [Clostridia bacterium]
MAKVSADYYAQRNNKNLDALDRLLEECLPPFCSDYFLAIESQTSPLTRLNYAHDLKIFFYFLTQRKFSGRSVQDLTLEDMESVTATDVEYFLSFLTRYKYDGKLHMCNDKAKARKLSAVRAMFKYFFNKDLISVNNTAKVATPKIHEKPIIRLEGEEIPDIIEAAESGDGLSDHQKAYHDRNKVRDTAILTLFLGTGIRISELVGLNNGDINFDNNSFIVTRKGGSKAILYFDDTVADAIKAYLDQKEARSLPKSETSPLFLSNGTSRIGVRAVENMVKKYAKIVSPLKKITPHKLRSTYGTALYKATGDIYVVADVLGHKDINTTKKHYAAITDDVRKSVVGKVKLKPDKDQEQQ